MQEFQNQNDLGGIKAGGIHIKLFGFSEVREDFASGAIVKLHRPVSFPGSFLTLFGIADQHVETIAVGESCHQCSDEGMASNSCKCSPFISNMLHLLQPDDCRSMALDMTCLSSSNVKVSVFSYCRFCVISSGQRLGNRCCSLNRQPRLQAIPWRMFLHRFNLHSADFHFRNLSAHPCQES